MLGDQVCLRIVGNKLDLEKDRHVPVDVAERLMVPFLLSIFSGYEFIYFQGIL